MNFAWIICAQQAFSPNNLLFCDMSTRRSFLRNSAFTTASLLVAPTLLSLRGKEKPIGIGIIGTGDRGSGLLSLVNDIDGLEARAVCDVIDFRLAASAKTAGEQAKAYVDYRRLLDDKHVDAVLLCTPFGMHGPMAIDILDAGKHIYCEKTMARGADDIQRVLAKAESRPKQIFQTGHQYHSSALYRKAKEMIDAGYLGALTAVNCQWNRNHSWRRPVPTDRPELERQINWRMYREYSGGLIAELMSHQLDFVNWVTGVRPAFISGQGGIDHYKDGRETFDNVHLQAQYTNGLDATFSCTTTNRYGGYEIRVLGSKGTIVLSYESGKIYHESREAAQLGTVDGVTGATITKWSQGEGVAIGADGSDPTRQALVHFRDAINTGQQPESDVQTGAIAAKCVDLGLQAAKGAKTVAWA